MVACGPRNWQCLFRAQFNQHYSYNCLRRALIARTTGPSGRGTIPQPHGNACRTGGNKILTTDCKRHAITMTCIAKNTHHRAISGTHSSRRNFCRNDKLCQRAASFKLRKSIAFHVFGPNVELPEYHQMLDTPRQQQSGRGGRTGINLAMVLHAAVVAALMLLNINGVSMSGPIEMNKPSP